MEIGATREYKGTATVDKLDAVLEFIGESLAMTGCSEEDQALIFIAAEEIYVNIAHYAYGDKTGPVVVRTAVSKSPWRVTITFEDEGLPYNPLDKEDPDITLEAEDRSIGGLGIFMVKEMMDDVHYKYRRKKNIFTMSKNLTCERAG